jgi:hypothetical protein
MFDEQRSHLYGHHAEPFSSPFSAELCRLHFSCILLIKTNQKKRLFGGHFKKDEYNEKPMCFVLLFHNNTLLTLLLFYFHILL